MKKQKFAIIIGATLSSMVFFSAPKAFADMPAGFTDQAFYDCIENAFKVENSSETVPATGLTDEQLSRVRRANCPQFPQINNLDGINKLTGLEYLRLYNSNTFFSFVDLSHNSNLKTVILWMGIGGIDVSNSHELEVLELHGPVNDFTSIDVTNNTKLRRLDIVNGKFRTIDLSDNTLLTYLSLMGGQLETIDLSNNSELTVLYLDGNNLAFLDISNNSKIFGLTADDILIKVDPSLLMFEPDGAGVKAELYSTLEFLMLNDAPGSQIIYDTEQYTFDLDTGVLKILDVNDFPDYIQITGIPMGGEMEPALTFKLQIEYRQPGEPVVPEEPEEPEIPVPNTGDNTRVENANAEAIDYVAIVAGAAIAITIAAYCGLRARRK